MGMLVKTFNPIVGIRWFLQKCEFVT